MSLFGDEKAEDVQQTLTKCIRVGTVSSINAEKHTARVVFSDEGNNVSYDLPIIVPNTYDNSDYQMPDINEDVLCLFLPDGVEDGFILGSWYAGEVKPPCDNPEIRRVKFKDGTTVSYNRLTHELDAQVENTLIHADRSDVSIIAPGDITIKAGGTVTIQGATVNIN